MIPPVPDNPPVLLATRARQIPLFVGATLGLFALCAAANLALTTGFAWRCPMLTLLHIPCPSCGSTRALAALSQFELFQAWRFNPLLVTAIPCGLMGLAFRQRLARYARWGWPLFIPAVLLNWVYLLFFLPR